MNQLANGSEMDSEASEQDLDKMEHTIYTEIDTGNRVKKRGPVRQGARHDYMTTLRQMPSRTINYVVQYTILLNLMTWRSTTPGHPMIYAWLMRILGGKRGGGMKSSRGQVAGD